MKRLELFAKINHKLISRNYRRLTRDEYAIILSTMEINGEIEIRNDEIFVNNDANSRHGYICNLMKTLPEV